MRFHQLAPDGSRIHLERVSEKTGRKVEFKNIKKGYETSKGKWVVIEPDELKKLAPKSTKAIEIEDFVALEDIDPIYFERTYHLAPQNDSAARAYALLAAVMSDKQRIGIGKVVMREKQYLAAIRPFGKGLAMSTMLFADEVIAPSEIDGMPARKASVADREKKMAAQIVDSLASDWDPKRYKDDYESQVQRLLKAKAQGQADRGARTRGVGEGARPHRGAARQPRVGVAARRSARQRGSRPRRSGRADQAARRNGAPRSDARRDHAVARRSRTISRSCTSPASAASRSSARRTAEGWIVAIASMPDGKEKNWPRLLVTRKLLTENCLGGDRAQAAQDLGLDRGELRFPPIPAGRDLCRVRPLMHVAPCRSARHLKCLTALVRYTSVRSIPAASSARSSSARPGPRTDGLPCPRGRRAVRRSSRVGHARALRRRRSASPACRDRTARSRPPTRRRSTVTRPGHVYFPSPASVCAGGRCRRCPVDTQTRRTCERRESNASRTAQPPWSLLK